MCMASPGIELRYASASWQITNKIDVMQKEVSSSTQATKLQGQHCSFAILIKAELDKVEHAILIYSNRTVACFLVQKQVNNF